MRKLITVQNRRQNQCRLNVRIFIKHPRKLLLPVNLRLPFKNMPRRMPSTLLPRSNSHSAQSAIFPAQAELHHGTNRPTVCLLRRNACQKRICSSDSLLAKLFEHPRRHKRIPALKRNAVQAIRRSAQLAELLFCRFCIQCALLSGVNRCFALYADAVSVTIANRQIWAIDSRHRIQVRIERNLYVLFAHDFADFFHLFQASVRR